MNLIKNAVGLQVLTIKTYTEYRRILLPV